MNIDKARMYTAYCNRDDKTYYNELIGYFYELATFFANKCKVSSFHFEDYVQQAVNRACNKIDKFNPHHINSEGNVSEAFSYFYRLICMAVKYCIRDDILKRERRPAICSLEVIPTVLKDPTVSDDTLGEINKSERFKNFEQLYETIKTLDIQESEKIGCSSAQIKIKVEELRKRKFQELESQEKEERLNKFEDSDLIERKISIDDQIYSMKDLRIFLVELGPHEKELRKNPDYNPVFENRISQGLFEKMKKSMAEKTAARAKRAAAKLIPKPEKVKIVKQKVIKQKTTKKLPASMISEKKPRIAVVSELYAGFPEDQIKKVKACVASLRTNSKKAGCTPEQIDQKVKEYLDKKRGCKNIRSKVPMAWYDGIPEDQFEKVKACVASLRTNSKKAGCTPEQVDQKVIEYLDKKRTLLKAETKVTQKASNKVMAKKSKKLKAKK
jgi:hypothetical protein